MEQRRFHRVKFRAPGELTHHKMKYPCHLVNLSLRGALVSADECIMIPMGETCTFSVCADPESPPMILSATIVHCFFSMVGVRFVAFADDAEHRLYELLQRTTPEPEKLRHEWEAILAHRETLQQDNSSQPSSVVL